MITAIKMELESPGIKRRNISKRDHPYFNSTEFISQMMFEIKDQMRSRGKSVDVILFLDRVKNLADEIEKEINQEVSKMKEDIQVIEKVIEKPLELLDKNA